MAVQPTLTFPGVYVQEVPSGVRTIVGVSTSTCCFVGRTRSGPLLSPRRIQTFTDFLRIFGDDPSVGDLSRYVRLFFLNGGTDCYVTRIASGAVASSVTLFNEAKTPTLRLTAKDAGVLGDSIRAAVTYDTQYPERTFNLELFRSVIDSSGQRAKADREVWANLSMDPTSASYAQSVLTQKSKLVDANDLGVAASNGYSLAGIPIGFDSAAANAADFRAQVGAALGGASANKAFRISVDGNPLVTVTIPDDFTDTTAFPGTTQAVLTPLYEAAIAGRINNALALAGIAGVTVDAFLDAGPSGIAPRDESTVLRIQSKANGDVLVQSAGTNDAAAPLGLGTANGGVEVGSRAAARPAPTGVTYQAYDLPRFPQATEFVNLPQTGATSITSVTLDAFDATGALVAKTVGPFSLADTPAPPVGTPMWDSAASPTGVATKLSRWRDAVNAFQALDPATFRWRAEQWGSRIAFVPTAGGDDDMPPFATAGTDLAATSTVNVRWYRLGAGGAGAFQSLGIAGGDGNPPAAADYDAAYDRIDHDVDIFNLLVLPPERSPGALAPEKLYSAASVFCQRRRAFLIMDPPDTWTAVQTATSLVNALRIGLVKDYSAVYFPRLTMPEAALDVTVGAAGAVAGLYARIDGTRGVWKAPAGTEASFRGVSGVDLNLTEAENGQLNPLGINAIRVMPEGIVSWGARTNDGADIFASEYKYIPIRRTALFIEESLYRGLKWVVFEPNDEALWAQIRLNVGAFMNNLFRQGAFQGTTPRQAFFVKVDAETTTQNDRNLGVVNVWVGFAPLKPAEFVVLYIQQIAGQIET
jgi:Bacteriophage tail sheath protein